VPFFYKTFANLELHKLAPCCRERWLTEFL